LERIRSRTTFQRALVDKLPFFTFSLLSSVITILAQKAGNSIAPFEAIALGTRLLVGAKSLAAYLRMMLAPLDLLPLYPYPEDPSLVSFQYLLPALFVIGVTAACLVFAKRQKVWLAVWLYYVIALVPVLGFIQVGRQSMADRYTYIPSIGPFLLVGLGASLLYGRLTSLGRKGSVLRWFTGGLAGVLILALSFGTIRQIQIWKSSIDLWNYAIAKEPNKLATAYSNRALVYSEIGQYDKALDDINKALAIDPLSYGDYNNRGRSYFGKGLIDTAIEDFGKAISINPNYDKAYYNRGFAYTEKKQYDKAIEDYNKAIAINPRYYRTYNYRGLAFYKKGLFDHAIEDFDTAITLRPNYDEAHNYRGLAYANKGLLDKAIEDFTKAIAINPNYYQAYSNRGAAYGRQQLFKEAISDFKKALAINSTFDEAYNNLHYALTICGPRCRSLR
jgi:protein O-mannosyl-transferase